MLEHEQIVEIKLELIRILANAGAPHEEIKKLANHLFEWLEETTPSQPSSYDNMFAVDIDKLFSKPNTALRVEITPVRRRAGGNLAQQTEITVEMMKYALEQALDMLTGKEQ